MVLVAVVTLVAPFVWCGLAALLRYCKMAFKLTMVVRLDTKLRRRRRLGPTDCLGHHHAVAVPMSDLDYNAPIIGQTCAGLVLGNGPVGDVDGVRLEDIGRDFGDVGVVDN
jgi:hypothetical protein